MLVVGVGAKRAGGDPAAAPPSPFVDIQLLGVNDFHGHLEREEADRAGPGGEWLGGAAYLGAHLERAAGHTRAARSACMPVTCWAPARSISSHFHDEPSIEATNLMRFDVGTVGNHEFDEGAPEMLRLIRGGQRRDGLQFKRDASGRAANTSRPGTGARFPYVSANALERNGRLCSRRTDRASAPA